MLDARDTGVHETQFTAMGNRKFLRCAEEKHPAAFDVSVKHPGRY